MHKDKDGKVWTDDAIKFALEEKDDELSQNIINTEASIAQRIKEEREEPFYDEGVVELDEMDEVPTCLTDLFDEY